MIANTGSQASPSAIHWPPVGGQQAGHPAGQEEIAFRGVLQGALRRVLDEPVASAVGAAVFGLWHIRPR